MSYEAVFEKAVGLYGESGAECVHDLAEVVNRFRTDRVGLSRWLKRLSNDPANIHYVIMYHGTSPGHNIPKEGLKRTSVRSKKSIQSQPGYTYLSLYPNSAMMFGEIAYPYDKDTAVYAVRIPLKHLLRDPDQLRNKRSFGEFGECEIKDTLADSLIHGNGGRVKRDIENYEVRLFGLYPHGVDLSQAS